MGIKRQPRLKCKQRNNSFLQKPHIDQVLRELTPMLYREARKIKRPSHTYTDDELVQEALLHIYQNRNKYDENIASIQTWCLEISRRKFYNLAKQAFRNKYHPCDSEGNIIPMTELNEEFVGTLPTVEDSIRSQEIITKTQKRLRVLSKKVFWALLTPPDELIEHVRKEYIQCLRKRHVGNRKKIPFAFDITNDNLATFFNVPYTSVIHAKDEIHNAMRLAFKEE